MPTTDLLDSLLIIKDYGLKKKKNNNMKHAFKHCSSATTSFTWIFIFHSKTYLFLLMSSLGMLSFIFIYMDDFSCLFQALNSSMHSESPSASFFLKLSLCTIRTDKFTYSMLQPLLEEYVVSSDEVINSKMSSLGYIRSPHLILFAVSIMPV